MVNLVLDFFTKLLSNFKTPHSVNYLISHNVTAALLVSRFGNMGNEVADFYINFLKVLSRRLTKDNISLFFNKVGV